MVPFVGSSSKRLVRAQPAFFKLSENQAVEFYHPDSFLYAALKCEVSIVS